MNLLDLILDTTFHLSAYGPFNIILGGEGYSSMIYSRSPFPKLFNFSLGSYFVR